jgi:NitT/TauT family transport system permease protein
MGRAGRIVIWRVAGFALLAAAWELAVHVRNSPALPDLWVIGEGLVDYLPRQGAGDMASSAMLLASGFALAVLVAVPLGVAIALNPRAEALTLLPAESMRNVAALTFLPALIVLFGLGPTGKTVVIFWTAWPAILLSTVHGIRSVDVQTVEAAHMDGAGTWSLLHHVRLPLAAPTICNGLRIGLGGGWISLVAAEMLGASAGLGYRVLWASQSFQYAEMYAAIFTIAAFGFAANRVLASAQVHIEKEIVGDDSSGHTLATVRADDAAAGRMSIAIQPGVIVGGTR